MEGREGGREGGGEGRLEAGLTCAVTVGLCDLALLKVLMRPDGVEDVRGTHDVVSPTSRTHPVPLPVAGRRGGGGRGRGEAEGLHAGEVPGVAHLARGHQSGQSGQTGQTGQTGARVKPSKPEEGQEALWRACRI